jgi:hypothetical protein
MKMKNKIGSLKATFLSEKFTLLDIALISAMTVAGVGAIELGSRAIENNTPQNQIARGCEDIRTAFSQIPGTEITPEIQKVYDACEGISSTE